LPRFAHIYYLDSGVTRRASAPRSHRNDDPVFVCTGVSTIINS